MDKPTIGIRIANGTYFPILHEDELVRKKVVLSPVKDSQKDVKIDLYRGEGEGMHNPVYVASLILNNIEQDGGKQVEITLLAGINNERILDAEAHEPLSDNRQFLSISLDSIEQDADLYEMPEDQYSDEPFLTAAIDDQDLSSPEDEVRADDDAASEDGLPGESSSEEEAEYLYRSDRGKNRKTLLLKAAVIILSIIFIILASLLAYTLLMKPALAERVDETVPAVAETVPKPEPPPPPPPVTAPDPEPVPPPPVAEEPEPVEETAPPPPEAIRYRIRWGDTLWDISKAYYRTPWLYNKIARDNNIKNPDLIYAGTYLIIKPE